MQLSLTGHHVDVTPPLREYVESKIMRIERHFDHVTDVHCILTVEKLRHMVIEGGHPQADMTGEEVRDRYIKGGIVTPGDRTAK